MPVHFRRRRAASLRLHRRATLRCSFSEPGTISQDFAVLLVVFIVVVYVVCHTAAAAVVAARGHQACAIPRFSHGRARVWVLLPVHFPGPSVAALDGPAVEWVLAPCGALLLQRSRPNCAFQHLQHNSTDCVGGGAGVVLGARVLVCVRALVWAHRWRCWRL